MKALKEGRDLANWTRYNGFFYLFGGTKKNVCGGGKAA